MWESNPLVQQFGGLFVLYTTTTLYDCTLVACGVIFIRPVVVMKLMSQGFKLKHTPARRVMIAIVCSFLPHKIGCKLLLLKLVADVYMLLAIFFFSFFYLFFRFLECHYFPQSGKCLPGHLGFIVVCIPECSQGSPETSISLLLLCRYCILWGFY